MRLWHPIRTCGSLLRVASAVTLGWTSARALAGNSTTVEAIEMPDVTVKTSKVAREMLDKVECTELPQKPIKVARVAVDKIEITEILLREVPVKAVKLEGLDDAPKKRPVDPEDEASVDRAVKAAEASPSGPNDGARDQAQSMAMTAERAAQAASQSVVAAGGDSARAQAAAVAAEQKVQDDYAKGPSTADAVDQTMQASQSQPGGANAGTGQPVASAATAGSPPAGQASAAGESLPEVLEPPAAEGEAGGTGDGTTGPDDSSGGPPGSVIEVQPAAH